VPSAKALYEQMRRSVAAAKSVRIKGTVNSNGSKLTIDVAGDRDGKNARALVNDGTGQAELLTVGGDVYVRADAAYWTKNGSAALAKVAAGKYVKIPAGTGLTDTLKVSKLLDGIFTDLPLAGALQQVERTDLGGTPAYLLTDRIGAGGGKIYVSADGKAYLLRIVSTKGNPGVLEFTEWNSVPPFSAPPASQQIKIPGA
jgi:predicted heme/steroid binding protein